MTDRLTELRARVKAAGLDPSQAAAADSAIDVAEQSARQLIGSLGRFHDLFDANSDLVRRADEIVSMLVAKP